MLIYCVSLQYCVLDQHHWVEALNRNKKFVNYGACTGTHSMHLHESFGTVRTHLRLHLGNYLGTCTSLLSFMSCPLLGRKG